MDSSFCQTHEVLAFVGAPAAPPTLAREPGANGMFPGPDIR
jgi:hypothetical protein